MHTLKKTPLKAKDSKTKIPCIFTIKPSEQSYLHGSPKYTEDKAVTFRDLHGISICLGESKGGNKGKSDPFSF